jgi:hypothetical protein
MSAWTVSAIARAAGGRAFFPPRVVIDIKALACELPAELGLPLSRLSSADLAREAVRRGLVASISGVTIWRWLSADAIKPWCYRSWISPRDPHFAERAGRVLDLYQGVWQGKPLRANDYVLCADEKTSIQARKRESAGPPGPGRVRRVESDYEREGALAYLAAWDVRRAKVLGLCERTTGIEPFRHLVDLVMQHEPYRSARRVFWVTDNGSSHRGLASAQRLATWYPRAIHVATPIHASWLNQVEIYLSVVQRKVLTPNETDDRATLQQRLLDFQTYYETAAEPFEWKFTRDDLKQLLAKLDQHQPPQLRLAA